MTSYNTMDGYLEINGLDAYKTWGVSLESGAIAELLSAPDVKEYVTNDCPNEDGIRVSFVDGLRYKKRDVQLNICITSKGEEDYLDKYRRFLDTLKSGVTEWRLTADADTYYRFVYEKMSNFSQLHFKIAKFVLNMVEPNPADRSK